MKIMLKKPLKKTLFYLLVLMFFSQLASCRSSSSAVGVVFKHRWNNSQLPTKTHKLRRHSKNIRKITIHHTATQNTAGKSDLERLRSARRYHIEDRGWGDIAYHYLIAPDGTIYQGRDSQFIGGSSNDYGTDNNLLIALMGNFQVESPTIAAVESLKTLVVNRALHYRINPNNINTHRHHAATLCPGEKLQNWFIHTGKYEIMQSYMRSR